MPRVETETPKQDSVGEMLRWLGLGDIPDAKTLDPDGRWGLVNAFKMSDGSYRDPVPQSVIERKGSVVLLREYEVMEPENQLLSNFDGRRVNAFPIFKEQAISIARFLILNLGVMVPLIDFRDNRIENFSTPRIKKGQNIYEVFPTNKPNTQVEITRDRAGGKVVLTELTSS